MGPAEARVHGGRGQAVTVALEELPQPVVAAVHGSCLGGGTEIALACDFVVASDDAVFGQPEIKLGVMPGWGGTRRLPRRTAPGLARRWILLGTPIPAAEALAAGLVDRVVPRAELAAAAMGLATELAQKAPIALAAAKYAINHAIDPGRTEGLAYELDLWARLFGTTDQKSGMQAFLEKRTFVPVEGPARSSDRARGLPWETAPSSRAKRNKREA